MCFINHIPVQNHPVCISVSIPSKQALTYQRSRSYALSHFITAVSCPCLSSTLPKVISSTTKPLFLPGMQALFVPIFPLSPSFVMSHLSLGQWPQQHCPSCTDYKRGREVKALVHNFFLPICACLYKWTHIIHNASLQLVLKAINNQVTVRFIAKWRSWN